MKKIKIIIVDDHPILRDGLKIALSIDKRFEIVAEAVNGEEAIKFTESEKPDIVVMDIDMPIMNGIEASKRIKKNNKKVKILMLTMHDNENYVFDAIAAGVDGYIFKMGDMDSFIEALNTIADDKKYFDTKVSELLANNYRGKNKKEIEDFENVTVPLTKREVEILQLISKGYTTNDIADNLIISFFTVSKHRKNIMKKLKVKNSAALIKYAYENHLINHN